MSDQTGVLSNGIAVSKESSELIQRLVPCASILPPAATVSSIISKVRTPGMRRLAHRDYAEGRRHPSFERETLAGGR